MRCFIVPNILIIGAKVQKNVLTIQVLATNRMPRHKKLAICEDTHRHKSSKRKREVVLSLLDSVSDDTCYMGHFRT